MDPLRELLERFLRDGDAAAMAALVARTRPRLLKAARRIGAPEDAEDAVQEAYHSLLRRGAAPEGPVFPWLLVAAVRLAYRRKALAARERALSERLAQPQRFPEPAAAAASAEDARMLRRAVTRLPTLYRDVVILHYFEGLSTGEAARLLGITRTAVTTRLDRARRLLRSALPHLLLLFAWTLQDVARPVTWFGGTAMKTKTSLLIAAAIVASGGAGALLAQSRRAPRARMVAEAPSDSSELLRLREESRVLRLRLGEEGTELEAAPAVLPGAAPEPAPEPQHGTMSPTGRDAEIPDAVREAARRLGVPDDALEAAWAAHKAPDGNREAAAQALATHREAGFLALVALLYGGESATTLDGLFEAVWRPEFEGLEQHLIDMAEAQGDFGWAKWNALTALGFTDTRRARAYLVERAGRETGSGLYMSLCKALGRLKEPGALDAMARAIRNKEWNRAIRGPIMYAILQVDQARARDIFVEYAREPGSDLLVGTLLLVQQQIDADLARSEAQALLDSPRALHFDHETLAGLRRIAGR